MKVYTDYIEKCSWCPYCDDMGDYCGNAQMAFREYRHKSIPPWCPLPDAPQKNVEAKPEQPTTGQAQNAGKS